MVAVSIVDLSPVPPGRSSADAYTASIDLAIAAERLGYDRYWVAEHHGVGGAVAGCCPEVLMGRIAAATTTIRIGAGTVLLNYSTPFRVAETARALHAMFPGRIDLGLGRADAAPVVDAALRGTEGAPSGDPDYGPLASWMAHEDRVTETIEWLDRPFAPGDPRSAALTAHGVDGGPEVWLLGSSLDSAMLAGRLGLRYGFAAFFNPGAAGLALGAYRSCFQPSGMPSGIDHPHSMLAVNVCCADTDREADRLRATVEHFYSRDGRADGRRLVDADTAVAELGGVPPATGQSGAWPRHLSGSPALVRALLERQVAETGADELVIQDLIADPTERLRSYELIAAAFGLRAQGFVRPAVGDLDEVTVR